MSDGFLRQRRNLLIVCLMLIFCKFSKLEISKFSILGVQFNSFESPESVYVALWVCWVYFLFRYYQYFCQEGLPKFIAVYVDLLNDMCKLKIDRVVLKQHPMKTGNKINFTTLKSWSWVYHGQEDNIENGLHGVNISNFEMPFPMRYLYLEIILSFLHVCFNRSAFTDYIFPVLISVFVVIYCSVGWAGSLIGAVLHLYS